MESFGAKSAAELMLQDIATQLPAEFELLEFIGEGGHGLVFKALFKPMQSIVALKILKYDKSDDLAERTRRMQAEAKILAKLDHPNIVKVFQMGVCKDMTPFMVCEYLESITLAQYLSKNSRLSPKQLYELFCQVLDALQFSHDNGLVHRDIKPSNIALLTEVPQGTLKIKVLDFGIARDLEVSKSQPLGLTRTIQISGSAPYMSPEQCRGDSVDARSDLYSVGCVLYECLAGRAPFQGETPLHVRYLQIHENPQLPDNDTLASLPGRAGLYVLCLKALSKNRESRPQTALEFKNELSNILAPFHRMELWTKKPKVKKNVLVPLLAFAASLCLCFGAYLIFRSRSQPADLLVAVVAKSNVKLSNKLGGSLVTRIARIKQCYDKELSDATLNPSLMARAIELHEEISTIIHNHEKKTEAMLYACWMLKAELEQFMNLPHEAKSSLLEAMNAANSENKDNIQAAAAYAFYTELCLLDIGGSQSLQAEKEARFYANKVLVIEKANENSDKPRSMKITPLLDTYSNWTNRHHDPNLLLGRLEVRLHHPEKALPYFRISVENTYFGGVLTGAEARMLEIQQLRLLGRKKEMVLRLHEYFDALQILQDQDPMTVSYQMTQLGNAAKNLSEFELANQFVEAALTLQKRHKVEERYTRDTTQLLSDLKKSQKSQNE